MVHAVKIGGENGRFASARSGTDFHDGIAVFIFVPWQQGDLNIAFKTGHSLFEVRNLIVSHGRHLDIGRQRKFAIVVQLLARRFEFVPFREQLFDARVLAHDLACALAVGKKRRIGNIAFELIEAFAFELN